MLSFAPEATWNGWMLLLERPQGVTATRRLLDKGVQNDYHEAI